VRGHQVFGERSSSTTGITDINDLFGKLSMGDNIDSLVAAATALTTPYVILSSLCQILLEFLVLGFGVDLICLSCLYIICSSIVLVCMISLITVL
jgi:hypothetical protein